MTRRLVVIGGDAAGMSAASLVKRRLPEVEIEAFEMGDYTSYGACGMPYFVAGWVGDLDELVAVTPTQFEEKRGIKVHMRHRAGKIEPDQKSIQVKDLSTGQSRDVSYDDLMIATGAEPFIPPGIDLNLPGVFALRGLPDARGIKQYIQDNHCRRGVVIGAGYIGMEMAEALTEAGLEVTVIDISPRAMTLFEPEISEAVAEELNHRQVRLVTGVGADRLEASNNGLVLTGQDGQTFTADLVVVGTGVKPRSHLAGDAGLSLGVRGAVSVDRHQLTSHPHIWSAGDCAESYHLLLKKNAYIPLALTANRAGRVAAMNILGAGEEFPGILGTAVCKVFDLALARTGLGLEEARNEGLDVEKVVVNSYSRPRYMPGSAPITTILIVEKGTQKLWGAQMVGIDGVAHRINTFCAALAAGFNLKQIHSLDLAYAPPFAPVWDPVLIASEVAMKKVK